MAREDKEGSDQEETMQPYDGSYVQGNLAGQEVSNPSLKNYYKDLID